MDKELKYVLECICYRITKINLNTLKSKELINNSIVKEYINNSDLKEYEDFISITNIRSRWENEILDKELYCKYKDQWIRVFVRYGTTPETVLLIAASAKREMSIREEARIDYLTKAQNAGAFHAEMKKGFRTIGIIYFDLNSLKAINDNAGHSYGDKYIQSFAQILLTHFRPQDCYRIGGDEFVVLLKDLSKKQFNQRVKDISILTKHLSAIGSSWNTESARGALEAAEVDMYSHKRKTR